MMNAKMGVSYQITQFNQEHEVVAETPFFDNAILNNSTIYVSRGFPNEPEVVLGKSALDIDLTQTGVVDPVREFDYKLIESARYIMAQPVTFGVRHTWNSTHEFKYTGDLDITLNEIGIDNFSRAIILDIGLKKFPIHLRKGDYLRIQMTFALLIRSKMGATKIDDQGGENSTNARDYAVSFASTALPNQWWKLLANSSMSLVTDVKSYTPSETRRDTAVIPRGFQNIYKFTTGETKILGYKLSNELMGQFMTCTFNQPITHFELQEIELTVNHTW